LPVPDKEWLHYFFQSLPALRDASQWLPKKMLIDALRTLMKIFPITDRTMNEHKYCVLP
jgi:hypothetical protein